MPWKVQRSSKCPASKPWAVIKESDGSIEGCHATKPEAEAQMRALYASEEDHTQDLDSEGFAAGDRESLLKAAEARAAKYGISVKDDGNRTPPKDYPAAESEYGDPVNFKYPADASHAKAALAYFNQDGMREKGGYSSKEWGTIGARLASLISKHLGERYTYRGSKLEKAGEKANAVTIVDAFNASRLLAGQQVRIVPLMPHGYHRGGMKHPPIDRARLQEIVENWNHRSERGYYQSLVPVNIEHEGHRGAIGSVSLLNEGQDGVYGLFDLTPHGRERLEAGEFAYLSPEIRWSTVDIETGKDHGASLAGVGVTNYPFFGDRTALYSEEVMASMEEGGTSEQEMRRSILLDEIESLFRMVRELGWRISDLAHIDEGWLQRLDPDGDLASAQRSIVRVIARAANELPNLFAARTFVENFVVTVVGDDGQRYPRSAFAVGGQAPDTWRIRLKEYRENGRGTLDWAEHLLASAARQVEGLPPETQDDAWTVLFEGCSALDLGPDIVNINRRTSMGSNANTGVEEERKEQEERFAQAVARLEALEAQAQTYKQALEERDATIAAQGAQMQRMAQERLEERFAAEAQTYTALGVKADVLAPELVWLYSIDDSDGRAHFQFFRGMLRQVDASLQRSGAFNERGASTSPSGTTWDVISRKITSLAKERGIDAPEGSAAYNQLSMEVLDTEPDLYDQYRAEMQSAA